MKLDLNLNKKEIFKIFCLKNLLKIQKDILVYVELVL